MTSATSGFTTVGAAYQTTCIQYCRIATVCGSSPLVDYRIFSIHFFNDTYIVEVRNMFDMLSVSRPVRIYLPTANTVSARPTSTVASGHNNSDSRTKITVKLLSLNVNNQEY